MCGGGLGGEREKMREKKKSGVGLDRQVKREKERGRERRWNSGVVGLGGER